MDRFKELETLLGPQHILTDPDLVAPYLDDWTGRYRGHSPAVVRPRSTAEVAAVVAFCKDNGIALSLQGGNTGLVGGGVPLDGEVVLSLRALNTIGELDDLAGQITAGAGTTLGDVQRAATARGWAYGIDLAARDSATIGGTVATNAGGLRTVHFGDTRAQLCGIEAVLGDGSVVSHLSGLFKDNTGYDLRGLLCGSEGTLGVVTSARLRLVHPAKERAVVLMAFDDVSAALRAGASLRRWVTMIEAVEFFLDPGLRLVCSALSLEAPFPDHHAAYVLAEAAGPEDPTDELSDVVGSLEGVVDAAVASSASRRAALWHYREGHTEAIATLGVAHKMDVSVPLDALSDLASMAPAVVARLAPSASTWLFGHAADGNVHVNVTGIAPEDETVDGAIFELAASLGGSVSAEHGIGTAKRRWLHLSRSEAEIAAMRALKRALDPAGILNPNVLF